MTCTGEVGVAAPVTPPPTAAGETPRWPRPDYCARCGTAPCACPLCHNAGFYLVAQPDERVATEVACPCRARAAG